MKTFDDLEFKEHSCAISAKKTLELHPELTMMSEMLDAKHAVIMFDNNMELSVLFGKTFYSDGISTYEAMELNSDNEPRGYLTKNEVSEYMKEIQAKDNK